MTLLESIVALVILGLAATGFLELFQRASVATRSTAEWSHAVRVAEYAMERAALAPEAVSDTVDGLRRTVAVQAWGTHGLRQITVSVELPPPGRAAVTLHRLVDAR